MSLAAGRPPVATPVTTDVMEAGGCTTKLLPLKLDAHGPCSIRVIAGSSAAGESGGLDFSAAISMRHVLAPQPVSESEAVSE